MDFFGELLLGFIVRLLRDEGVAVRGCGTAIGRGITPAGGHSLGFLQNPTKMPPDTNKCLQFARGCATLKTKPEIWEKGACAMFCSVQSMGLSGIESYPVTVEVEAKSTSSASVPDRRVRRSG